MDSTGNIVCDNPVAFASPKNMTLPKAEVTFKVGKPSAVGQPVPVTLKSDAFALYVTLTTTAQGRFAENAFVMPAGTRTVLFYPIQGVESDDLAETLRLEHAATFL